MDITESRIIKGFSVCQSENPLYVKFKTVESFHHKGAFKLNYFKEIFLHELVLLHQYHLTIFTHPPPFLSYNTTATPYGQKRTNTRPSHPHVGISQRVGQYIIVYYVSVCIVTFTGTKGSRPLPEWRYLYEQNKVLKVMVGVKELE